MCNIYIGGLDSKIENFYHLSHSVSLEFRNLVFQTYNLALPEDVHFLAYLLFTSFRDISSRHPVTSREVLAENYRAQKALRQGRFRAMPTLTEFQSRTGVQLEVTEYKLHERKARTALPLLTFELELLLQRDAAENVQEVVFVSGDVCNERWVN